MRTCVFAALLAAMLASGCAGPAGLDTVTQTLDYQALQKAWIRCNFDKAEDYLWADPDPQNIATAALSSCNTYPNKMTAMFLDKDVHPHRFEPLLRRLEQSSRRYIVHFVIDRRAKMMKDR